MGIDLEAAKPKGRLSLSVELGTEDLVCFNVQGIGNQCTKEWQVKIPEGID